MHQHRHFIDSTLTKTVTQKYHLINFREFGPYEKEWRKRNQNWQWPKFYSFIWDFSITSLNVFISSHTFHRYELPSKVKILHTPRYYNRKWQLTQKENLAKNFIEHPLLLKNVIFPYKTYYTLNPMQSYSTITNSPLNSQVISFSGVRLRVHEIQFSLCDFAYVLSGLKC